MEAVRTSETSVDNHFTLQYNPEDSSEQVTVVATSETNVLHCVLLIDAIWRFRHKSSYTKELSWPKGSKLPCAQLLIRHLLAHKTTAASVVITYHVLLPTWSGLHDNRKRCCQGFDGTSSSIYNKCVQSLGVNIPCDIVQREVHTKLQWRALEVDWNKWNKYQNIGCTA
jgi:hypothetical protein